MEALFAQVQVQTNMMTGGPANIIGNIAGFVCFVCFVWVVVKMFQNGKTGLAITSILTFCCGIGYLIAFVYGWIKSGEWKLMPVMLVWTLMFLVYLACLGYIGATQPELFQMPQNP